MRYRLVLAGISVITLFVSALAQNNSASNRPRVTITPAPWISVPRAANPVFPSTGFGSLFGSDFFPAAPTTLFNNTGATQFYFPSPSLVLDDVLIPNSRDTDGDNTYYLTQLEIAFYVPTTQTVNYKVYLARANSPLTPNPADLQSPILTGTAPNLAAGAYILTVTFGRCTPAEITALTVTSGNTEYDHFLVGLDLGPVCSGAPGWLIAAGPDASYNAFYWNGNQVCGGAATPGVYWFGGNPVASFHLKVTGAATLADAIVTDPDVDGNGCVDDADLLAVLFAFGSTGNPGIQGDTNCDGTVDDADLLNVLFAFGQGCGG